VDPERRTFRIFFWQKFVPLTALPFFALLLAVSPIDDEWSRTGWIAAGALTAAIVGVYLLSAWLRSGVILNEEGLMYHAADGRQTWPHDKLLKVKLIGNFRVRMCYDPGIPDKHMHISFDLIHPGDFINALLDWYAATTGHELEEPEAA
jgi:signal transduction histidine kinase